MNEEVMRKQDTNTFKRRPAQEWKLRKPISLKLIGTLLLFSILLTISAKNTEIDKGIKETIGAVGAILGIGESSVITGSKALIRNCFPLVLELQTEVNRINNFDPNNLPWLSHVETRELREYSALTDSWTTYTAQWLIEPFGYAKRVAWKMIETIEMAIWGTILSILISLPLAYFGAKNLGHSKILYLVARGISSFNRAVPDMIYALFFVLMYGFGPVAGIMALGVHTSGFLGKFFADEVENADPNTQEALKCIGSNRIKVLLFAVLPQVLPQMFSYAQYILERNVRMATVLGIVGAGGIGMELKGRWDMFNYGHVSTILLAIFITVIGLEYLTQKIRKKLF
jgi:phosphonate transport system permease protein